MQKRMDRHMETPFGGAHMDGGYSIQVVESPPRTRSNCDPTLIVVWVAAKEPKWNLN